MSEEAKEEKEFEQDPIDEDELDDENVNDILNSLDEQNDILNMDEQGNEEVIDDSILRFSEHKDSVYSISISPDSTMILSGDGANRSLVWDVKTGAIIAELEEHKDSVVTSGFSYSGKYLATGSMDGTIKIYKTANLNKVHRVLEGPDEDIIWLQWHSKSNIIVAGCADNNVWMWDASKGEVFSVLAGHSGPVNCGSFSSDGKELYTAAEDGTIIIWNVKDNTAKFTLKPGSTQNMHEAAVTCLAVHPKSKMFLTGSVDSTACLINASTGKIIQQFKGHEESCEAVGFCNSHALVATSDLKSTLKVWDVNNGSCRATCIHPDGVVALQWHPTLPHVYTASLARLIHCWEARTGELLMVWSGHLDTILGFQLAPKGDFMISCSDDQTVSVFSLTNLSMHQQIAKNQVQVDLKKEEEKQQQEESKA